MVESTSKRSRVDVVSDELRRVLRDMPVGVPLPPVSELMRTFAASQTTIDRSYAILAAEGRISRRRGKGVFAAAPLKSVGEIAIVLNRLLMEPTASPIYGMACARLGGSLQDLNPRWKVKLHFGGGDVMGSELPATLDLLDPAVLPRLRGVLSFHPLLEVETKLAAANVPVLYLGTGAEPWGNGLFFDARPLFVDGILHLAAAGCRSVWMLGAHHASPCRHLTAERAARIGEVTAAARECGMRFRDEWVVIATIGSWSEQHGYDLFMRLWSAEAADRPDGILVVDDILCGGVLRAILQLGLELPRDLRLVTKANKGIALPYHRSVSRIEYDVDEWVDKAVRMLETRSKGPPSPPRVEYVNAKWIQGETT